RHQAGKVKPPGKLKQRFEQAVKEEQLADLENLYFAAGNNDRDFTRGLVQLSQRLGDKYQVDELAGKYEFTGRQKMDVPTALTVKEELELIDKLLKQLEEAKKNAQLAIIDVEELNQFIDREGMDSLRELQQQVEDVMREMARQQGIDGDPRKGFELTPKAFRLFQSKILTQIF
ncbi:MAG: hypothetical protein ABGY75_03875, partial [Gemmataceae bacterium]